MAQRSNILKSFAKNLPKMAQFLPILLLFLATFAPKATAEKPDLLTVTVDPQYVTNVRRFNVYLMQAKGDGKFEDCESPAKLSTNPIEFTLDWSKCPRAVEQPEQLRHMQILIDVVYMPGEGQNQPNRMNIWLNKYSDVFHRQLFGGGKAKLVKISGIVGGKQIEGPKLVFLEGSTGTPGTSSQSHPQQHAGTSSSTHKHPLTVTVDPQYISNVRLFNVYMKQAEEYNEFIRKHCEHPTVSSMNPIVFTLDWSKCPRAVERPEQLRHLYILIEYKRDDQQEPDYERIDLEEYSAGFYRRVFGGGKARLVKSLETVDGKPKEFPKLVYLEGPTGTPIPPAGTATFNVEYQHRTVSSIRYFSVTHPSNFREEMDECQPKNVEMSGKIIKFALDLAKCNVHDMEDLLNLHMELRVALQKGQYPNRVEGRTELVVFKTLAGQPEDELRQLYSGAHQLNLLLSEKYKPMLSLNGQHWANVEESSSASTSSHQHAGASSSTHGHALKLLPKSREEILAQEAIAGYYPGRKLASRIAFWIPREILKGPPRFIKHKGEHIIIHAREIHLVMNDEQHKMRLWHADGDKCPVEIAGDFDGISAVLDIDWTKCTPKPLKSHEELEGMELVVYYQLDQDEPTKIRHTFKQDEPLQDVFGGAIIGRLELFEDGSVVFKRNA